MEQLLDDMFVQKYFRVKKSILRGDWMAQTMGKCMEAAMKSLALWNSPWSVEMETNFQLASFLRSFFRTCQVDMASLSNLKRANTSISYLQGVYHQGKKQSQPLACGEKKKA